MIETTTKLHRGTDGAMVIRLSDTNALKEMEKKVVETAQMYPDAPGAKTLEKLGASPLQDPDGVNGQLFTGPGFKAVSFRIPGTRTRVLMALGSATKVNIGEDDNAFVNLLTDMLEESPVESLWVADFARLLRSIDFLSATWKAVRSNCRYVRHAGAVIDTQGPSAEIQFLFEALSAAADARSVVKRTVTGKMRSYVRGRCPLSKNMLPPGYVKNRDKKLQLAKPAQKEVIRAIVQVLGDPTLSNTERVQRVADAGGLSLASSRERRRAVRIDELGNPAATVGRWYELLDVWATGTWKISYQLPLLLNTTLFELPVEITERGGVRYWELAFDLDLPPGGWATADEFEAAVEMRDLRAEHLAPSGGGNEARKALSRFADWEVDDFQFALISREPGTYELRRRPKERATKRRFYGGEWRRVRRGWGRSPHQDGERVCVIDAVGLHTSLARGLVEAATDGLSVASASASVLEANASVTPELREQLSNLRRRARNARRNANDAPSENERKRFLGEYNDIQAQAAAVESDILQFAGPGDQDSLPINIDSVAIALAAVARDGSSVPGTVADAIRQVIHDLRIVPTEVGTLRWEAKLRIPLAGGTLTLGPASGYLEPGHSRTRAAKRTATLAQRAGEASELVLRQGLTVEQAASELGIATVRRVAQTVRDHLRELGLAPPTANYLVDYAVQPLRAAVWERIHKQPFPRHLDRAYAAHAVIPYLDGTVRTASVNRATQIQTQAATLQTITDAGGWVPDAAVPGVCQQVGISTTTMGYYTSGRHRRGHFTPPILQAVDGGIGLIPCPHDRCDGWATVVSLHPEVQTQLLCTKCLRMPDPSFAGITFTEEYRQG